MLTKINGKWIWEDEPKSAEIQEKINKHLEMLSRCKVVDSKELGTAYVVEDTQYWD